MTAAIFLVVLCLGFRSSASALDPSLDAEWEEWKILYEKSYSLVSIQETVWKGPRVQVLNILDVIDTPPQIPPLRFVNYDYCKQLVADSLH